MMRSHVAYQLRLADSGFRIQGFKDSRIQGFKDSGLVIHDSLVIPVYVLPRNPSFLGIVIT